MRKLSLSKLDLFFEEIAKTTPLFIPTDKNGGAAFTKWQKGAKLSNALNTVKSPKDFFFPQLENLMEFKVDGKNIEVIDTRNENSDFVIFGVRACDVKSFEVLDRVFLAEPKDSYYANKREHGIIISLCCNKPAETCFCKTFGIDPTNPKGDISAYKTDENIYFKAETEKGENLLKGLDNLFEEIDESEILPLKEKVNKIMDKLPLKNLKTDAFGGGKTNTFFNSEKWDELSSSCLGCGTCTYVCPTCQCYDIKDYSTGHGVIRYRCWDSCMYSEFTKMAHGNNRLTQKERFRQRFMHKLVYYPENNNGLFSCVGCGRCLNKCPISMNIVKVMKELGEEANG